MLTLNDIRRWVEALSPRSPVEIVVAAAPYLPWIATSDPTGKLRQIGFVSALR